MNVLQTSYELPPVIHTVSDAVVHLGHMLLTLIPLARIVISIGWVTR
jgi:hypothetical protein